MIRKMNGAEDRVAEVGGMSQRRLRAGAAVIALASATALSVGEIAPAQDRAPPRPSLNLYGATGLIDMPSGEAQPDAQISVSYSQFGNTSRRNFTFQVLPRVSGTLRYSTIEDWGQGGDPTYDLYDRSLDATFQLTFEDRDGWRPAIALGFRDFLGTGVYSSEFLVASKTVADDFTLTAGVGWGRCRATVWRRTRSARRARRSASATSTSARAASRPGTPSSTARTSASSAAWNGEPPTSSR
jgi:hypothetical protein